MLSYEKATNEIENQLIFIENMYIIPIWMWSVFTFVVCYGR